MRAATFPFGVSNHCRTAGDPGRKTILKAVLTGGLRILERQPLDRQVRAYRGPPMSDVPGLHRLACAVALSSSIFALSSSEGSVGDQLLLVQAGQGIGSAILFGPKRRSAIACSLSSTRLIQSCVNAAAVLLQTASNLI